VPTLTFVLDENVAHPLAGLLRSRGLSADSAKELGRLSLSDPQVLLRVAEGGQTLVTHNSKDFRALHEAWVAWRQRWAREVAQATGSLVQLSRHAGILIAPHLPIHTLAQIIEEFVDANAIMDDRLFAWNQARHWHEVQV
jgi:hypothetical protein